MPIRSVRVVLEPHGTDVNVRHRAVDIRPLTQTPFDCSLLPAFPDVPTYRSVSFSEIDGVVNTCARTFRAMHRRGNDIL